MKETNVGAIRSAGLPIVWVLGNNIRDNISDNSRGNQNMTFFVFCILVIDVVDAKTMKVL